MKKEQKKACVYNGGKVLDERKSIDKEALYFGTLTRVSFKHIYVGQGNMQLRGVNWMFPKIYNSRNFY